MGLGWHPIYEMEKNMFETTNQYNIDVYVYIYIYMYIYILG